MGIPVPAMLYGTLGKAGRGWSKIAAKAWASGWEEALNGVEFVDLMECPGPIMLGSRPSPLLVPECRVKPYFAMYCVHPGMLHAANQSLARDQMHFRLRDLTLQALDWPWYAISTLWPGIGFLPPCDDCFQSTDEWHNEEKKVALQALRKITRHFSLMKPLEMRFTGEGLAQPIPPPGKVRIFGVYRHCLKLGIPKSVVEKSMVLPPVEVERQLFAWMDKFDKGIT